MLVDDRKEIRNVGMPPQFQPLWMQIKQFRGIGIVFASLNLSISGREEDGFSKYSELGNTHYPIHVGVCKLLIARVSITLNRVRVAWNNTLLNLTTTLKGWYLNDIEYSKETFKAKLKQVDSLPTIVKATHPEQWIREQSKPNNLKKIYNI